jgi:hypothetical protein
MVGALRAGLTISWAVVGRGIGTRARLGRVVLGLGLATVDRVGTVEGLWSLDSFHRL